MAVRNAIAIALLLGLALGTALGPGPVAADQNDPRLEALFAQLKAAPDAQAAQAFEEAIWGIWTRSDDTVIGLLMQQGLDAMARRDLRVALGKFDQIVKIVPGFAEGWNKRATVHYLLGNHAASLSDIAETLKLEPRHFGALSGRGLVLLQLDEPTGALESFESALEVYPKMIGASRNAEFLRRELKKNEI
jgi:tetratricopeptide (TPR) repeat protein